MYCVLSVLLGFICPTGFYLSYWVLSVLLGFSPSGYHQKTPSPVYVGKGFFRDIWNAPYFSLNMLFYNIANFYTARQYFDLVTVEIAMLMSVKF